MICNKLRNFILFSLISLWLPINGQAAVVHDLFSARIPVASQSAEQRDIASGKALMRVLIKVSGNANIATLPGINDKLAQANQMVQQYSYVKQQLADATQKQQLFIKVDFEPQQIIALLHTVRQAVWGNERPLLIAWVSINNGEQRYLLANNDASADQLEKDANGRGLPLTVPMMDLRDMNTVSVNDVVQANYAKLQTASQRYGQGEVLLGQLQLTAAQQWHANWILFSAGQRFSWSVNGDSINDVMQQGMNAVADNLAARFAILENPNTDNSVLLRVSQINSAADYAAALRYLQRLAPVKDVAVVTVSADQIVYKLKLLSNERALIQAIALNPKLKPMSNDNLLDHDYLQYQWAS